MTDPASEFLALHEGALLADADPMAMRNLVSRVADDPDGLVSMIAGSKVEGMSKAAAMSALSSVLDDDVASYGSPYAAQEFAREASLRNGRFLASVADANGLSLDQVDEARHAAAAGRSVAYEYMLAEYFSR